MYDAASTRQPRKLLIEQDRDLDTQPQTFELVIKGEPATFATKGEIPWKSLLLEAFASAALPAPLTAVSLEFKVSSNTRSGKAFDLDNLCEPVFCMLAKAGWLDGGRRGLSSWYATKVQDTSSGVAVRDFTGASALAQALDGPIYAGALPRSGSDLVFAHWVAKELPAFARSSWRGGAIGVGLRFGDTRVNIGDIATGRVKNVIDCLFPLIGGTVGAPEDWRIEALYVERGAAGLKENELQLVVWEPEGAPSFLLRE